MNIEKLLIFLVLLGQTCCQGLYLPVVDMFPAYLYILVFLGIYAIVMWIDSNKAKHKTSTPVAGGFPLYTVLLILYITFVYIINNSFDLQKEALMIFSFTFCLACYQVLKSESDFEWLLKTYVLLVFISSLVEIGQFFNIGFCYNLWFLTHSSNLNILAAEERLLGLSGDIIGFGYNLSASFAILHFIDFKRNNVAKKMIVYSVFIFAIATNNTRSAIIGALFSIIFYLFSSRKFAKSKTRGLIRVFAGFVLVFTVLWIVINPTQLFLDTRFYERDTGTEARWPMFLTAMNHMVHYPLGLGDYKPQAKLVVDVNDGKTYYKVLENPPHNIIANCGACYGVIGILILTTLYAILIKAYMKSRRQFQYKYYDAAFCGIICLVINAFFHNLYILNGDFSSFVLFPVLLHAFDDNNETASADKNTHANEQPFPVGL